MSGAHEVDVVFLHGAGMDHTVWRHQSRWLMGRGRRVVAPDLPGHGSDAHDPLASVEEAARWVADAAIEQNPATVFGHSMGALVAIELAASRPELVDSVVLVGASPRMRVHPELLAAARDDLPRAARLIGGWSFPRAHTGGHPEPGSWQMGATIRLVEASRPGVLAVDLEACRAYDTAARSPSVKVPTVVVAGGEDRMTPPAGSRDVAGLVEDATFLELDGLGHQPMSQDPRRFNAMVAAELDRLRPGWSRGGEPRSS